MGSILVNGAYLVWRQRETINMGSLLAGERVNLPARGPCTCSPGSYAMSGDKTLSKSSSPGSMCVRVVPLSHSSSPALASLWWMS